MNDQFLIPGVLEAVLVAVATFFATRWYLEGRADAYARKVQAEADRILEEAENRRRDAGPFRFFLRHARRMAGWRE